MKNVRKLRSSVDGKISGSPSGHAIWRMTQRVRRSDEWAPKLPLERRLEKLEHGRSTKTPQNRLQHRWARSPLQARTPPQRVVLKTLESTSWARRENQAYTIASLWLSSQELNEQEVLSGEPHRHVSLRSERRSSRLTLKQTTEITNWSKTQRLERRQQQRISQSSGSRISDLTQIWAQ